MKLVLTGFAAAALAASPAAAATYAIVGGKVATMTGSAPIEGGTVVIRDGRIVSVGADVGGPAGAEVIDAKGKWVTPGLFAAFSRLGIDEVDAVDDTNDIEADESPYNAAIDIAPSINPRATPIAVTRIEGVTRAAVVPDAGNDIFGGQGLVMSLGEGGDLVMKPRAFEYIVMGETGARLAGGSRGALFTRLADAFAEAQAYARNPRGYDFGRSEESLLTKADADALSRVVSGGMPAMIYVNRASDIVEVLKLREDYPKLRIVLAGASEGWMVADKIAAAGVPVIATVTQNLPETFESLGATQSNIGRMVAAGVKVAIAPVSGDATHQVRLMPQLAGNLIAQAKVPGGTGVTHAQAMAAMTRIPAEIYGLDKQLGTLAPGKLADVVVWDGDPIELSSAPTAVFIGGKPIPLTSRQTKLRDRYNPLGQDTRPKHYVRPWVQ
jgi:imidazolonepropionase-like amidohydrolase